MPPASAQALWTALVPLRRLHPGARWMDPEQFHATLVFLGATEPARVPQLVTAIAATARQHAPFSVSTGEAGGRVDDRRGGVAWLSLTGGRRELARLSRDVDRAVGSGVYGKMAPRPHVTVARRVDAALLDDVRATATILRVDWQVDRMVLYRSHTGPSGSRYELLANEPLTLPDANS